MNEDVRGLVKKMTHNLLDKGFDVEDALIAANKQPVDKTTI